MRKLPKRLQGKLFHISMENPSTMFLQKIFKRFIGRWIQAIANY
jgi:hypothetical protein